MVLTKLGAVILGFVSLATAQSAPGFEPSTAVALDVSFSSINVKLGQTLLPSDVQSAPNISLATPGSDNYAVIMLDLSVNLGNGTPNTTLVHWIKGFFTAAPGLTNSKDSVPLSSSTSGLVPYFPPGPPAQQTHTYTLLLYKQPKGFTVPSAFASYFQNITASVNNRIGFNATAFADASGLGLPVASSWFLVTNAANGQVTSSTTGLNTVSQSTGTLGVTSSTSTSKSTTVSAPAATTSVSQGVRNVSSRINSSWEILGLTVLTLSYWIL